MSYLTDITDSPHLPKRLAVPSLASAMRQLQAWQEENALRQFKDADGMPWTMTITATPVPDESDSRGVRWRLKLQLSTKASAADFVSTGVLDATADQRLIGLLGGDQVEMHMKPQAYELASEEEARARLAEILPNIKESFNKTSITAIKRSLIGQHIDRKGLFGNGGWPTSDL